jgi:hypothetical protein
MCHPEGDGGSQPSRCPRSPAGRTIRPADQRTVRHPLCPVPRWWRRARTETPPFAAGPAVLVGHDRERHDWPPAATTATRDHRRGQPPGVTAGTLHDRQQRRHEQGRAAHRNEASSGASGCASSSVRERDDYSGNAAAAGHGPHRGGPARTAARSTWPQDGGSRAAPRRATPARRNTYVAAGRTIAHHECSTRANTALTSHRQPVGAKLATRRGRPVPGEPGRTSWQRRLPPAAYQAEP